MIELERAALGGGPIVDLAVSDDGEVSVAATPRRAWLRTGSAFAPLEVEGPFAVHPRKHRLLATVEHHGAVLDVARGTVVHRAAVPAQAAGWTASGDPVWVGYEEVLRGGTAASSIRVEKGAPGKVATFAAPYFRCARPALSPGAQLVALWDELTVRVYATAPIAPRFVVAECGPIDVAITAKSCAIASARAVRLHECARGAQVAEAPVDAPRCIALSRDGSRLFCGTETGVTAWTITASGLEQSAHVALGAPVTALASDLTGRRVLVGTERGEVVRLGADPALA